VSAEIDHDRLRSWLELFGRAWERRDREQAAALFSEDGSYRETPFAEPVVGADEIRAYWARLPKARGDISFGYEILAVTEPWAIARWHGSYTHVEGETRVELDGILLVSLDDEGHCRDFREWSNRRERQPSP
jgi:ketosteroid isomerase-like protein